MKKKILSGLLALALAAGPAEAASLASCTSTANPVNFGSYDPLSSSPLTSTGSVSVSCSLILGLSLLVGYTIELSAGNSGNVASRQLRSGSNSITYNLYQSAGSNTPWGAGASGLADGYLLGVGGALKTYNVFGRIPASQSPAGGNYTDNIIVTITY